MSSPPPFLINSVLEIILPFVLFDQLCLGCFDDSLSQTSHDSEYCLIPLTAHLIHEHLNSIVQKVKSRTALDELSIINSLSNISMTINVARRLEQIAKKVNCPAAFTV